MLLLLRLDLTRPGLEIWHGQSGACQPANSYLCPLLHLAEPVRLPKQVRLSFVKEIEQDLTEPSVGEQGLQLADIEALVVANSHHHLPHLHQVLVPLAVMHRILCNKMAAY